MDTGRRAAVLVVHLWIEDGDPARVRARVTRQVQDDLAITVDTSASSGEGICALVRQEIERLLASRDSAAAGDARSD